MGMFLKYLTRMAEKVCGVRGIDLLEDDGCGCHGCSSLAGKIRTRVASVYLVSTSRRCHVFWPHPAGMVRVPVSDLEGTDHSDPVTHLSKTTLEHDLQQLLLQNPRAAIMSVY
jgi:hypothetical protein